MIINQKRFIGKRYSSGELKLIHADLLQFANNGEVHILYDGLHFSFFELLIIIHYYQSQLIAVHLTLAYLPYQRMDHKGSHVETVAIVADMLNRLQLKSLKICESHCDLSYFKNAISISLVEKLCKKVFAQIGFDPEQDILCFTDKSSLQRYAHLGKHSVRCEKVRDKQTGLISTYNLFGTIPVGAKVVILDDIISTGDTLMHAIDELAKHTNQSFTIVCGHFEKNKYNQRLLARNDVAQIVSSNSLTRRSKNKLKIIPIISLLEEQQ